MSINVLCVAASVLPPLSFPTIPPFHVSLILYRMISVCVYAPRLPIPFLWMDTWPCDYSQTQSTLVVVMFLYLYVWQSLPPLFLSSSPLSLFLIPSLCSLSPSLFHLLFLIHLIDFFNHPTFENGRVCAWQCFTSPPSLSLYLSISLLHSLSIPFLSPPRSLISSLIQSLSLSSDRLL